MLNIVQFAHLGKRRVLIASGISRYEAADQRRAALEAGFDHVITVYISGGKVISRTKATLSRKGTVNVKGVNA